MFGTSHPDKTQKGPVAKATGFCFSGATKACFRKRIEKQNPWQCKALQGLSRFKSLPWKSAANGFAMAAIFSLTNCTDKVVQGLSSFKSLPWKSAANGFAMAAIFSPPYTHYIFAKGDEAIALAVKVVTTPCAIV